MKTFQKTPQEITLLKKAAKLTTLAFKQIVRDLKTGKFKTENDIKKFLQKFAKENNTKLSFPPIIATGKNSINPHHPTSNTKLVKGFLLIDMGICYQNYCSDMTRMLYLGKPTEKEKELYTFLLQVQKQTIRNIRLQQKTGYVEKQTRKALGRYARYFIHSVGHGVGKRIHELPLFRLKCEHIIQKNQVFTIEPGIYLKDFGLRIEDTLLMKRRPVILTRFSKKLISINL
ncbi:M24 family metallopeptidase [Candidatus Woesearchaeota archaeon]|nr:M24 family metallopeptidase [Candidatus Woesearchaeota archaeon]